MSQFAIASLFAILAVPVGALAQSCVGSPVTVQILGSGGPIINPDRASSSYLLWVGGQAKLLVDMGGGAFLRFGQSQAKLSDLSLVAVSHLHPDHVSDLPALLWLSNQGRKDPLPIYGPSGSDGVPPFQIFLSRLFDSKLGAFQVLSPTLGGPQVAGAGGGVRLEVGIADVTKVDPTTVFDKDGLTVTALGIPHGPIPTLAYRVQTRGVSCSTNAGRSVPRPRNLIKPSEES
jgi:ribonuclease BN (tRNA processing enzyme)